MKQFTSYQAPVDSFPLSEARIGLFKAGRYTGFDIISPGPAGPGIPITLGHSVSTLPYIKSNNSFGPKHGTLLTTQGVVLKTDESFNLTISPNPSGEVRLDIIFCQYTWSDNIMGGSTEIGVIEGVPGMVSTLTDPARQFIIGYVKVPTGATFNSLTYTPAVTPLPGGGKITDYYPTLDDRYARLQSPNTFYGTQADSISPIPLVVDGTGELKLNHSANTFILTGDLFQGEPFDYDIGGISSPQGIYSSGTRITIMFKNIGDNSYIKHGTPTGTGITIDTTYFTGMSFPTDIKLNDGDIMEFVLSGLNTWYLVNNAAYLYRRERYLTSWVTGIDIQVNKVNIPLTLSPGVTNYTVGRNAALVKTGTTARIKMHIQLSHNVTAGNPIKVAQIPVGNAAWPLWDLFGVAPVRTDGVGYFQVGYMVLASTGEVFIFSIGEPALANPQNIIVFLQSQTFDIG